jgi:vancomycin resistance protein YoaR
LRLTFNFYGTDDGRKVSMTTPIVKNVIPAPPPLYNDDPNLPQGQIIQTDFAANGATVSFSRTVTKGNQTLDNDLFVSNYRPWQAVFTRGTQ